MYSQQIKHFQRGKESTELKVFQHKVYFFLLSLKHTEQAVGRLKHLGRLRRVREQICSVCSAALEVFRTAWTASAPIQHAKSESIGCWPSEPLDTLIGCMLAV